jgi:cell division septal protein FtsQ
MVFVILVGAGCGIYRLSPVMSKGLSDSDYFKISGVDVIGVERADRDEIARAVRVTEGESVLETDLLAMRDRIETVTWVKSAEVVRELPSKIVIHVEEYTPVGVIIDEEEARFVDPDGMTAVIHEDAGSYPVFVGMTSTEEITGGARLMVALLGYGVISLDTVTRVTYDPVMGYEIVTGIGTRVSFGSPPFEEKIERLKTILPDAIARGHVEYMYLDVDDRIIVKNETP